MDLPEFAAFYLLKNDEGTEVLRNYYRSFAKLAVENNVGLVLESPTWRANPAGRKRSASQRAKTLPN